MSTTNVNFTTTNGGYTPSGNNKWAPRKIEPLTCPSGQVVLVKRPGPDFTLRVGRVARTYAAALSGKPRNDGETDQEYYERLFDEMSEEELDAYVAYGRHLLVAMCVSPALALSPKPERGEIGPDDLGSDFWFLLDYGMRNFLGISVPVGDTEVEATDLEPFRAESGIQGDSVDGAHVQADAEQPVGDQGLVGSEGA